MNNYKRGYDILTKTIRVIMSCENVEHVKVASKFRRLAEKQYSKCMFGATELGAHFGLAMIYLLIIKNEEIQQQIKQQIKNQLFKLRGI